MNTFKLPQGWTYGINSIVKVTSPKDMAEMAATTMRLLFFADKQKGAGIKVETYKSVTDIEYELEVEILVADLGAPEEEIAIAETINQFF